MSEAQFSALMRRQLGELLELNEGLLERVEQLKSYILRAGLEIPDPDAGMNAPITELEQPPHLRTTKRQRTSLSGSFLNLPPTPESVPLDLLEHSLTNTLKSVLSKAPYYFDPEQGYMSEMHEGAEAVSYAEYESPSEVYTPSEALKSTEVRERGRFEPYEESSSRRSTTSSTTLGRRTAVQPQLRSNRTSIRATRASQQPRASHVSRDEDSASYSASRRVPGRPSSAPEERAQASFAPTSSSGPTRSSLSSRDLGSIEGKTTGGGISPRVSADERSTSVNYSRGNLSEVVRSESPNEVSSVDLSRGNLSAVNRGATDDHSAVRQGTPPFSEIPQDLPGGETGQGTSRQRESDTPDEEMPDDYEASEQSFNEQSEQSPSTNDLGSEPKRETTGGPAQRTLTTVESSHEELAYGESMSTRNGRQKADLEQDSEISAQPQSSGRVAGASTDDDTNVRSDYAGQISVSIKNESQDASQQVGLSNTTSEALRYAAEMQQSVSPRRGDSRQANSTIEASERSRAELDTEDTSMSMPNTSAKGDYQSQIAEGHHRDATAERDFTSAHDSKAERSSISHSHDDSASAKHRDSTFGERSPSARDSADLTASHKGASPLRSRPDSADSEQASLQGPASTPAEQPVPRHVTSSPHKGAVRRPLLYGRYSDSGLQSHTAPQSGRPSGGDGAGGDRAQRRDRFSEPGNPALVKVPNSILRAFDNIRSEHSSLKKNIDPPVEIQRNLQGSHTGNTEASLSDETAAPRSPQHSSSTTASRVSLTTPQTAERRAYTARDSPRRESEHRHGDNRSLSDSTSRLQTRSQSRVSGPVGTSTPAPAMRRAQAGSRDSITSSDGSSVFHSALTSFPRENSTPSRNVSFKLPSEHSNTSTDTITLQTVRSPQLPRLPSHNDSKLSIPGAWPHSSPQNSSQTSFSSIKGPINTAHHSQPPLERPNDTSKPGPQPPSRRRLNSRTVYHPADASQSSLPDMSEMVVNPEDLSTVRGRPDSLR